VFETLGAACKALMHKKSYMTCLGPFPYVHREGRGRITILKK